VAVAGLKFLEDPKQAFVSPLSFFFPFWGDFTTEPKAVIKVTRRNSPVKTVKWGGTHSRAIYG
jgi:hypothetical protein